MKVLIAPNAFKGSLDSVKAAETIRKGLEGMNNIHSEMFPIADGGDSTLEVFAKLFNCEVHEAKVKDPLNREMRTKWGMINSNEAIIEMAKSSGIRFLTKNELDPLKTNTYGTGQLIAEAIRKAVKRIYIGLGGSATVDAGTGMLQALGAKLYDESGNLIQDGNALMSCEEIDLSEISDQLRNTEIVFLVDVENPLLGDKGAAFVFGPQKGASESDVEKLEGTMRRFSELIIQESGRNLRNMPGAGAAGGIAFTFASLFDAKVKSGIDFILDKSGIKNRMNEFDLVITGEGKLDSQTMDGKGPGKIAELSKLHDIPCLALCGMLEEGVDYSQYFTSVFNINHQNSPVGEAIENTERNLLFTAKQIGSLLQSITSQKGK